MEEGGLKKFTVCFSRRLASSQSDGHPFRAFLLMLLIFQTGAELTSFPRLPERAPTAGEIEQLLSFKIIRSFTPSL